MTSTNMHHTRIKFKTKQGDCTKYALCCGYTQETKVSAGFVVLSKVAGNEQYDVKTYRREDMNWQTFDTLQEARRYFKAKVITLQVEGRG